jgi:diaminohydroxyphosphoribosylaminopyrimidine deaminase / 5-amino-6-(5-phosphoribosylamino)uracil reductase
MTDTKAMKRALTLALRGSGNVDPNPRVGAVIIKDGEIVAEGWHRKFGAPHAEVDAVANAKGIDLEGATMFINLEPCSHFGKTPPCAPMLVEKGFKRVVVGMQDPNPEVAGKGIQILEEAGIDVEVGLLEEECRWVNRFFLKHIATGIPYVLVKVAQSLDGCIATSMNQSKWITGEESRKNTHLLRQELDSILIGKNTAAIDNPSLTVRRVKGRNPKKIIFDTNLELLLSLKVFNDESRSGTIVCCDEKLKTSRKADNLRAAGVQVLPVPVENSKLVVLETLKSLYKEFQVSSVLVEGGAGVFSSFLESGEVDELHIFQAPIIIGDGIHSFEKFHTSKLKNTPKFKMKSSKKTGPDIHYVFLNDTE